MLFRVEGVESEAVAQKFYAVILCGYSLQNKHHLFLGVELQIRSVGLRKFIL